VEESKIAVFICSCNNEIGKNIDLEELEKCISTDPKVVIVKRHDSLCQKEGQDFLKNEIESSKADRVVVAACTPRTYEEINRNSAESSGINQNLYEQTGIREQCEWVHANKEMATTKALCLTKCAIAKVALSQAIEEEDIQIKNNKVLIIGGGVSGMKAALELTRKGIHSIIVERGKELGGLTSKLSPGALAEMKAEIPTAEEVLNNDKIEVLTESEVKEINGGLGNYQVFLESKGIKVEVEVENTEETTDNEDTRDKNILEVGGIIVATGSTIFDSHRIPELGFEYDDVITSLDLEKMLAAQEIKCPSNGSVPKRINFIQCVGSRDDNKGNSYCSLVCCTYAIRQALDIKTLNPDIQVYVHYMDLRGPYPGFEESYQEAQLKGIQFIRGRVAEVQKVNDKLVLRAENMDLGEPFDWKSDLIVLSVGQEPSRGNNELSEMLHIPLDVDGFLGEYNYRWDIIDRRGISVVGTAQGPRNIRHALTDAKRSAHELAELFEFGAKTKEVHSVIDPSRCKGCGICEALCPYEAITLNTIADYETEEIRKVSEVNINACQGCGACTMACPCNVPVLSHFTADQILAEIETLT
jgi:heterodisulfide reductase subunit A